MTQKLIIKKKPKMGRKTLYEGVKTLKKVQKYIDSCKPVVIKEERSKSERSISYEIYNRPNFPTIYMLSKHLGVSKSTVYEWEKKYSDFSDMLEEIKDIYEHRLIEMSFSGQGNASLAKFILSSRHNYLEKEEVRFTASDMLDMFEED